jgi:hypothetical protein
MPQKTKPKPPPKTRNWKIVSSPKTRIVCYVDPADKCNVAGLWQGGTSDFHDAVLQSATAEINKILDRVERGNHDSSRHLCFINFQSRLMLVWTQHGGIVSSADDDGKIAKALKIKSLKQR